jgi:type IV secretion system protein VirD4
MTSRVQYALCPLILLVALTAATQWSAGQLAYHPALGQAVWIGSYRLYAPWSVFGWSRRYGSVPTWRPVLAQAQLMCVGGALVSVVPIVLARGTRGLRVKPLGGRKWATLRQMKAAGLLRNRGTVLGSYRGRLLTYDGPEHQMVSGASRSGKGVGHVMPTLLNWPHSVLAYDVKGELWQVTAGFRSKFSHCLFFNPTRPDSARFNPLLEIRKGPHEVRDAQNVVEMLVNPDGSKLTLDIWDQQASQLLVALILHVLYTEPDDRKHFGMVRHRLLDWRRTVADMIEMPHRHHPATRQPEVHPEIALVARELLSQPPRFQASVRGTAASYLTLFADPVVCRNVAHSDFALSDLACADAPVSLYVQPPPSDAPRLKPLVRLIVNQACRTLMEHVEADGRGRPKRHRLLLLLDEFPTLGRLEFFVVNLRQMAGYGIKAQLIVQSLNDVVEQYGPSNSILDNCHILTAFASADPTTQQRISQMTGMVTEYRESYSAPRFRLSLGHRTVSYVEQVRPLLQPGDVRELPNAHQLVFVTGFPPMRTDKIRYYADKRFAARVLPPPAQGEKIDSPGRPPADWHHEQAKGPRIPSGLRFAAGPGTEDWSGGDSPEEVEPDAEANHGASDPYAI